MREDRVGGGWGVGGGREEMRAAVTQKISDGEHVSLVTVEQL